jgi:dephospho-CoA kinase
MIIGLSGYARSGKDTVADFLVTQYGFERVAFADPIRNILYDLNPPVDGESLASMVDNYGWDIAKSKEEVRTFLQTLGYSARMHIHQDVWVMAAFSKMRADRNYVIADVRFLNEAEHIKKHNGEIWRVERPGVEAVNQHVSEWEMDNYKCDHGILNDGNLDQLHNLVKTLYEHKEI